MSNRSKAVAGYPALQGRGLDIMVGYTLDCSWIVERIKKDIADKDIRDKDLQPKKRGIDITI